jgi:hypothetical protein
MTLSRIIHDYTSNIKAELARMKYKANEGCGCIGEDEGNKEANVYDHMRASFTRIQTHVDNFKREIDAMEAGKNAMDRLFKGEIIK